MRKIALSLLTVITATSTLVVLPKQAKAWDVNNWMDRADAHTCPQLVQTATYFLGKYYSTGNSKFKELSNDKIAEAKQKGCK
jgi:hypothetical protein